MSKSRRNVVLLVAVVLFIAFALPAFASGAGEKGAKGGKMYIPVISKGFQHQFWQTVKLGSEDAAKKYGVDITFEGPPSEADIQPQVQMLVNAMAKSPAAIALAALDTNSVMDQLNEAIRRNIPIIGFDSGVPKAPKGSIYATAATDSYAAAGVAAERMFPAIKAKIEAATDANPVTIVDFNQDATSTSVTLRGKGFRDKTIQLITTQTKHGKSDIKVTGNPAFIAADSPTGGKAIIINVVVPASPKDTDATNSAAAIMNGIKADNVVGIFCSNEGTARAVLTSTNDGSALPTQYAGLVVIGFDAGKAQKAAVKSKYFFGAITQDPYQIGYMAVELAYKAVKGEKVADVDTGAKFYDASNMDQTEIARLLYD
ncbi:MAG: ABC transporter substrate-binding protein [Spirochaetes bacterium]|nr:ABC transporter substrate-binding protein [Spirochaetota bacterium]